MDENPTQVQWAPDGQYPHKTPLVLIHDGGGTTFSYHLIGSLDRDVYAIHNPHFHTAEPWAGGMDEMARHYIQLLKNARISGNIFLGGWSLGGFLSVAMARMLAVDRGANIMVKGMILIDSPFHIPLKSIVMETSKPALPTLPELVQKSFDNCEGLLNTWQLPTWSDAAFKGRVSCMKIDGQASNVLPGHVLYKPLHGSAGVTEASLCPLRPAIADDMASDSVAVIPPTSVLLRCVEPVSSIDSTKPVRVDIFRDKVVLGWSEHYPEFIKAVIDVDAHHYNLFEYRRDDFSKIDAVTGKINTALQILDTQTTEPASSSTD